MKESVRNMLNGERKSHSRMFTANYYWRWWEFGISGFGTTTTKVDMENMSDQLYCDALETELKRSMVKFPNRSKMAYQEDLAAWHRSSIFKD